MRTILSVFAILVITCVSNASPIKSYCSTTNSTITSLNAEVIFGKLNIHRKQGGVSVNWTITGAESVTEYIIQRSFDGSSFETIDHIPAGGGKADSYQDNNCYPGYLYYRIIAVSSDGSTTYSPVDVIRIVKNG
jgi:hypothetical protein